MSLKDQLHHMPVRCYEFKQKVQIKKDFALTLEKWSYLCVNNNVNMLPESAVRHPFSIWSFPLTKV